MGVEINLFGIDKLLNRLEKMGEQAESIEENALKEGAEVIRQEVENLAPRSQSNGKHLADNIITTIKDGQATIGPSAGGFFYGHFLEFGTKKMSARPFMGPAFENKKNEAQKKMAEVIQKELDL
jgi:HK97 gp10 family phage protein